MRHHEMEAAIVFRLVHQVCQSFCPEGLELRPALCSGSGEFFTRAPIQGLRAYRAHLQSSHSL
jgi:hypothetical protein